MNLKMNFIKVTTFCSIIFLLLFVSCLYAGEKISWVKAENLVKNLRCSNGGTIDGCLNNKAKEKAVEDLDWHVYPRDDGFEVERLMLLNGTMQLKYK